MVSRHILDHERRYLDIERLGILGIRHRQSVLVALQPTGFAETPLRVAHLLRCRLTRGRRSAGGFLLESEKTTIEEPGLGQGIAKVHGIWHDPSNVEERFPIATLRVIVRDLPGLLSDLSGAVDRERADGKIIDGEGVQTFRPRLWRGNTESAAIV